MTDSLPSHLASLLQYIERKGQDGHRYDDLHDYARRDVDLLIDRGLVILRGDSRRRVVVARSVAK